MSTIYSRNWAIDVTLAFGERYARPLKILCQAYGLSVSEVLSKYSECVRDPRRQQRWERFKWLVKTLGKDLSTDESLRIKVTHNPEFRRQYLTSYKYLWDEFFVDYGRNSSKAIDSELGV